MSKAPQHGRRRAEVPPRTSALSRAAAPALSTTAKSLVAVAMAGVLVAGAALTQQPAAQTSAGSGLERSVALSTQGSTAEHPITVPREAHMNFAGLDVSSKPSPTPAPKDGATAAAPKDDVVAAAAAKPVAVDDPAAAKAYAASKLASFGWGADQMSCLEQLWERESNWRTSAENPSSGAYGIAQSLPAGKMESVGKDWATNYQTQITWGLGYIQGRYGSPCGAWGHSESVGWY